MLGWEGDYLGTPRGLSELCDSFINSFWNVKIENGYTSNIGHFPSALLSGKFSGIQKSISEGVLIVP